ncbi:hypothetical protein GEMRC1_000598 [Eukaryota sp. GEM-RC1]
MSDCQILITRQKQSYDYEKQIENVIADNFYSKYMLQIHNEAKSKKLVKLMYTHGIIPVQTKAVALKDNEVIGVALITTSLSRPGSLLNRLLFYLRILFIISPFKLVLLLKAQAAIANLLTLPHTMVKTLSYHSFWQVKLHPDDVKKASLSTPGRSISFTRAAFGLRNVPAFFQNLMVSFFADEDIFIYIDDIIVCSKDFSNLLSKLRKILLKARDKRVRFGLRKCDFITYKSKIENLGCFFQNFQRSISPDQIKAICSLPRPKTLSEVRIFVGSINFIRDWIPNLASVLEPISNLLRKTNKIIWTAETETCFKEILKLISSNIPLNLPDAKATILISTDASEVGLSGIIWEQIEDCPAGTPPLSKERPDLSAFIARSSRTVKRIGLPFRRSCMQFLLPKLFPHYLLSS